VLNAALLAEDLFHAVKLLFEVFSPYDDGSLPRDFFRHLFGLLTRKDSSVSEVYKRELEASLAADASKARNNITFGEFRDSGPGRELANMKM
jgi:hypothetical protein